MKRKQLSTILVGTRSMNVNALTIDGFEANKDYMDIPYTRQHWARVTTETPLQITDVKEW